MVIVATRIMPSALWPPLRCNIFSRRESARGQARRFRETRDMSALRLIAAECCTAVLGAPGQFRTPQASFVSLVFLCGSPFFFGLLSARALFHLLQNR